MSDPALPTYSISSEPLFDPGPVYITPTANTTLSSFAINPLTLIIRHMCGDWGELVEVDRMANAVAVEYGGLIASSYILRRAGARGETKVVVWIITAASDGEIGSRRPCTTILLPGEN